MTDTDEASDTPLSDLIAAHVERNTPQTWATFLDGFRAASVGIIAVGVPEGTGGNVIATAGRPISVGLTRHAGGRPMALAFADPPAFARRFGRPYNAEMSGSALLATVLHNPECAGVLLNSALAEVSVVIDRPTAEALLQAGGARGTRRPWWRLW